MVIDDIDHNTVMDMRHLHIRWRDIATFLDVSIRTLDRWREKHNFVDPGFELEQDDLDDAVRQFVDENPAKGERFAMGYLHAHGITNNREDIRKSLQRVDPAGKAQRRLKPVAQRREYNVQGPNHLWHLDGHHKLIKFGLVTLGCIDGFSRTITYLECVTNNRKTTALALFEGAVARFGLPSRVRCDRGVENRDIALYMINARGRNRGSCITGQSRFNTRIERLWRDVMTAVIKPYKIFLQLLERRGLVPDNDLHKYCVHYCVLPRINDDLQKFIATWNAHPLSTERNRTPMQLFYLNRHKLPPALPPDDYGEGASELGSDGSSSDDEEEDEEEAEGVVVPPVYCPLSAEQVLELTERSPPLNVYDEKHTWFDRFMFTLVTATEILNRDGV